MHAALHANLKPGRAWLNACCRYAYLNWDARCGLANNAHAQDVLNGVIVDGVRGGLCHSSRRRRFAQIPTFVLL